MTDDKKRRSKPVVAEQPVVEAVETVASLAEPKLEPVPPETKLPEPLTEPHAVVIETVPVAEVRPPEPEPHQVAAEKTAAPESVPISIPPTTPKSGGFGALLGAGLIGSLLTAGAGAFAVVSGYVPLPSSGATDAKIATLQADLKKLTERPVVDTAPLAARLDAADKARAALEAKLNAIPATPSAMADDVVQSLRGEISGLKDKITSGAGAASEAMSAKVAEQLAAAQQKIASLDSALKQTAASVDAKLNTADGGPKRMARMMAVQALRSAFDKGGAYGAELAALKPLLSDPKLADGLEGFASGGLPSQASVKAAFMAALPQMMKQIPTPPADGIWAKAKAAFGQIVEIHPVGETPGTTPADGLARIEAKLTKGDLAGALVDFNALPEPMRQAGAAFGTSATKKLAAEQAMAKITADAVSANNQ